MGVTIGRLAVVFFVIPIVVALLGYSHIPYLFTGEFTQHLGSIEVSYIQMAKFIKDSMPFVSWQPRWYLGYPMSVIYTPLVPYFEVLTNSLLGWSYSHAYRVLTAFAYVAGLVTLYFFARTWFRNTTSGLITALCYGILPSIIALLYDEVATDRFALNFVEPRRFTILVRWGEGPHIVSLIFLPLAALFLVKFLRHGNKWMFLFGVIFAGLVALTNSVGTWGMLILFASLIIGEIGEREEVWKQTLIRSGVFGLVSLGLIVFWFNPLFLTTFFKESGGSMSFWKSQFPWGWIIGIGIIGGYLFLSKKLLKNFSGMAGSLLFFAIMFWFVNTYYASGSEKLELVPQVLRLNTEVDMGLALVSGAGIGLLGTMLKRMKTWVYYGAMAAVAVVAFVGFAPRQWQLSLELPQYTKPAEKAGVDLADTAEYEVAKTLEGKIAGDERVFVPGNYAFYLNYYTDVPQLRGALFQSAVNLWPDHIYYQVTNGKDADISLAWLKIANVGHLVYGGPREIFRDYQVPASKFDSVLDFAEEKNGDRYYKVPLQNTSLAKAVPHEINKVKTPFNAIDREPIMEYTELLEQSNNELTIREIRNGEYAISGEVGENENILVQMAYAPGWKAQNSSGQTLGVSADPLGFILINPNSPGVQEIKLKYDKPFQFFLGWIMTGATIITLALVLVFKKRPLLAFASGGKRPEAEE